MEPTLEELFKSQITYEAWLMHDRLVQQAINKARRPLVDQLQVVQAHALQQRLAHEQMDYDATSETESHSSSSTDEEIVDPQFNNPLFILTPRKSFGFAK